MSAEPRRLGKYELLQRLGRGGMAEVWKAFDPQLRRFVAIKFLHADLRADPDFTGRFLREAQAIASLRHPNIVHIYDFQIAPLDANYSMPYMVMDYIEGQTLADYIRNTSRQGNPLSPRELVRLFTSICVAVDYAHQHGMIHRDIKPSNILLDKHNTTRNPMGEPILTDFGIVKLMGTATGTFSGAPTGTPLYISPEQVRGNPGNERSDIYSLGIILYEMCTGTPPFRGENPHALWMQHLYDSPTPPRLINQNISPALETIILRCLMKSPDRRFPSATSLAAALAEAFNLPVPDEIKRSAYPQDLPDHSTYFQPLDADTLLGIFSVPGTVSKQNPSSPLPADPTASSPEKGSLPSTPSSAASIPSAGDQSDALGETAKVPVRSARNNPYSTELYLTGSPSRPAPPLGPPLPVHVPLPATTSVQYGKWRRNDQRRRIILIAVAACAVIVLIVYSLAVFLSPRPAPAISPRSTPPPATTVVGPQIVGQAAFEDSNQGTNDEIQVTLHGIPNPAAGKSYYGWLPPESSNAKAAAISLGRLQVNQGGISLLFTDPQHNNLLTTTGSILITEENANTQPQAPTTDKKLWRYFALLPQTAGSDGLSGLTHLRYLLVNEPDLQHLGLNGGLDFWLLQNTTEVEKWSQEGVDHTVINDRRAKVVNILYYLHGQCAQQDLSNAALNTWAQPDLPTIATNKVPLLDCAQSPLPGNLSYIDFMIGQLNGLSNSPNATTNQKKLATQIASDLRNVKDRLGHALSDAQQLVKLDDTQFPNSPLIHDMNVFVSEAYGGWTDPGSGTIHPGVNVLYRQIQNLATFDIQPYTAH